ncbi:MAG: glutamine-synthetase adenylyltransferase [Bryobacteraceae bacterium]|nr:glutamine-synthetase adenylyltransferase [Bryobacteraceae bacterium]
MLKLADQISFHNRDRAVANLTLLGQNLPDGALNRLRFLLASSADPDTALHYLARLREERPAAFQRLSVHPAEMQYLVAVFSASRFLAEDVLKYPQWIERLRDRGDLFRILSSAEYLALLDSHLAASAPRASLAETLAYFRRKELLRILIRDLLGFAAAADVALELSNLADAVLETAYRNIRGDLAGRYGAPRYIDASGASAGCGFSILALGKLGGQELNYSSDIDLIFIYSAGGETGGPEIIANRQFFGKVANQLTDLLSTYSPAGKCYRIDLRLRPEGRLGEVCISVDGAKAYYGQRARDWELQMLIKARVCAGEPEPGQEFLDYVEPLIYRSTLDFSAVESVSETRERIQEKANARSRKNTGLNVKLARGGIRDIEFLVQCLQRLHGGRNPWLRHGGTLLSLRRLYDKRLLSHSEYSRLATAYEFLRNLEHRLQFEDDRQTHELPSAPRQMELLARRMPDDHSGIVPSAERLLQRLNNHLEEVQEIYERVIHSQQPLYYSPSPETPFGTPVDENGENALDWIEPAITNLVRFLDDRAPQLAAALSRSRLRRGAASFEYFLERVVDHPEWLGWLDQDSQLAAHVLDLFEHSSHFAEQLVRKPELIEEMKRMRESPGRDPNYAELAGLADDPSSLRRFFQREMLRLQSESICLQNPIFDTLKRTSQLADAVVAASYDLAIEHTARASPPSDGYAVRGQMMVIALGRLGMLEFDLASDADLVFALPDDDAAQIPFWTRVAERMIQQITAYTGEGVMFAVDTRLRPNGREGPLVQTERSFKDYFGGKAEAWEGIAYMKSRAVAGNTEGGTAFLNELQDVDWRRYGQSGRSKKKLWEMRMRLEKEQGGSNPLKAGRGGYYDIDFALMYLRLKSAGIFFKVLNTPGRIDIIERMGHLDRQDAEFLLDAATFYRAVDHGLRVFSGHAEGNLPKSRPQLEALDQLVSRWTPEHLHDQPLDIELAQIQSRTREFFDRLFG